MHSVRVDLLSYKAAADLHRVKPSLVASIIMNLKKDPDFVKKREAKIKDKLNEIDKVTEYVQRKLVY